MNRYTIEQVTALCERAEIADVELLLELADDAQSEAAEILRNRAGALSSAERGDDEQAVLFDAWARQQIECWEDSQGEFD